jgi:hypothetical protein
VAARPLHQRAGRKIGPPFRLRTCAPGFSAIQVSSIARRGGHGVPPPTTSCRQKALVLSAYRMILGVGVSGVGSDDVADPAERAA